MLVLLPTASDCRRGKTSSEVLKFVTYRGPNFCAQGMLCGSERDDDFINLA